MQAPMGEIMDDFHDSDRTGSRGLSELSNARSAADSRYVPVQSDIPDISEIDVVWQFDFDVAIDAWNEYKYDGVSSVVQTTVGTWEGVEVGRDDADCAVTFDLEWTLTEVKCSAHGLQEDGFCNHAAMVLFQMTAEKLLAATESPIRLLAKERAKNLPEDIILPVEPLALPQVRKMVEHTMVRNDVKRLLRREDWLDVIRILEILTAMNNPRSALSRRTDVDNAAAAVEGGWREGKGYLKHSFWTMLEAAYEAVGDGEGLKRLYCYFIAAGLSHGAEHSQRLQALTGEQWPKVAVYIVHLVLTTEDMEVTRNFTLETIMKKCNLAGAALAYCQRLRGETRDRAALDLSSLLVTKYPDETRKFLLNPLYDADSWIYQTDLKFFAAKRKSTHQVMQWMGVYRRRFGFDDVKEVAGRITQMFPNREYLREQLATMIRLWGAREQNR